jgi:hypothetical protein
MVHFGGGAHEPLVMMCNLQTFKQLKTSLSIKATPNESASPIEPSTKHTHAPNSNYLNQKHMFIRQPSLTGCRRSSSFTIIFINLLLDLFIRNSLAPEKVSAKINGKQLSTQAFNDHADDNEFETNSETDSVIRNEDDCYRLPESTKLRSLSLLFEEIFG